MTRDWRRLPWELRYEKGSMLASDLRKLVVRATHRHCRVEFQGPVRLGPGFSLHIPNRGSFIVGPGVDLRRRFFCEISGNGVVRIGAGVTFTADAIIQCSTSVTVLDGCQIGQSCMIIDGNHRYRDHTTPFLEQGYDYRPVTVGPDAVILSKVTILADVGERSVVAAHAVVNRDVPPYCLVGGVPARVIDYFGPPELRPAGIEA